MPQKLTDDVLNQAEPASMAEEMIPTLEDAMCYLAPVRHNGQVILCKFGKDGKWRPTSFEELQRLMI